MVRKLPGAPLLVPEGLMVKNREVGIVLATSRGHRAPGSRSLAFLSSRPGFLSRLGGIQGWEPGVGWESSGIFSHRSSKVLALLAHRCREVS